MKYRILLFIILALCLTSCIPRTPSPTPVIEALKLQNIGSRTYTEGQAVELQTSANRDNYMLALSPESFLSVEGTKLVGVASKGFKEGAYTLTATSQGESDSVTFNIFVRRETVVPVVNPPTTQTNIDSISTLPINNNILVVPEGKTVLLDRNLDIRQLEIKGTVVCDNRGIEIRTRLIYIDPQGTFECGTASNPYTKKLNIILRGGNSSDDTQMGTHFVANRGILSLHGTTSKAWTRLDNTVNAGQNKITLSEAIDVSTGDSIVISSSSMDMNEAETRIVIAVNGRTLTLNSPLQYMHNGTTSTHNYNNQRWVLDNRAAVGVLSRNISIRAVNSGNIVGGHIMSMVGGKNYISGVQLSNMGQGFTSGGKLSPMIARYPFHWHLQGDVSGQYFRNNSIVDSNNRCAVIHGSDNATVTGNVCYRHVGHGYFLEDGVETGNTLSNNLGLLSLRASGTPILETDNRNSLASRGPATFWISNTDNTVNGNVAAGSQGSGYWYFSEEREHNQRFGSFEDNTAMANNMAFTSCFSTGGTRGVFQTSNPMVLRDFTVTTSGVEGSAIWTCGSHHEFKGLIVYDSGSDIFDGAALDPDDAAIVTPTPITFSNSLFFNVSRFERGAFEIYDSGFYIRDSHFQGYTGRSAVFTTLGASAKRTSNRISGTTFSPNTNFIASLATSNGTVNAQQHRGGLSIVGSLVHDLDGSIASALGVPFSNPSALVVNQGIMRDSNCSQHGHAAYCPYRYANVRFELRRGNSIDRSLFPLSNATVIGADGRSYNTQHQAARPWYQVNLPVNTDKVFMIQSASLINAVNSGAHTVNVTARFAHDGDSLIVALRGAPNKNVAGFQRVGSLADLKTSVSGYFWAANVLYIKGVARGGSWGAEFSFDVR